MFQVYRHLLMLPDLRDYEIRWEMDFAGEQVDLWLRHLDGGEPSLVECGDYSPSKVHEDIAKIKRVAPKGSHYFLSLFRGKGGFSRNDPAALVQASLTRSGNGLDPSVVEYHPDLCREVSINGPGERVDVVSYAVLKAL